MILPAVRRSALLLGGLLLSASSLAMDTSVILVNPSGISVLDGQARYQDAQGKWHDAGSVNQPDNRLPTHGRKLNNIRMDDNAVSDVRLQPIRATSRQVRPYVILTSTRVNGQTY